MTVPIPVAFAASLLVLLPLQRWMSGEMQRVLLLVLRRPRAALLVYALVLLPGVALHEASHWLAARVLGVKTQALSLVPKVTSDGTLRLGYVTMNVVDPFRSSLIGIAPLVSGTLLLGWLGFRLLGLDALGLAIVGLRWADASVAWQRLSLIPLVGLWIYLTVAVSNTMFPSKSDRAAWWAWLLVAGLLAALVIVLGVGADVAKALQVPLLQLAGYLTGVFVMTAALDLMIAAPLWLLERLLTGRP
jgi:hypothetical protein